MFTNITAPVPSVPEAAIHFDANGASLLTLDKQNRAHRVGIQTGRRAGGMVELVKGPPPGTRVILSGGAFVLEGDRKSGVWGKGVSGRVDLGGRRMIKKKKQLDTPRHA